MNLPHFSNAGRKPVVETLPTLLEKPISLLEKLPCIAGVISGKHSGFSSTLLIDFHDNMEMDITSVLKCFDIYSLRVISFATIPLLGVMKITITLSTQTKALLN